MAEPTPVNPFGDVAALDRTVLLKGPYRRLFKAQVVSSFGDWLGFLAVVSLASQIGGSNADVAVGVVLSARLIPGFFFGAVGTALIDRWDRKRVMVACDVGRGVITGALPFIHTVWALVIASFCLELLTLMWTPAKEASVPNLVRPDQLPAANSAGLAAAYGTILPAVLIFPGLTVVASLLGHVHYLRFFRPKQQSLAFFIDVLSFFVSAYLISRLTLVRGKASLTATTLRSLWNDAKDGWKYIHGTYRIRAVIIGFCTGVIGGGMMVPLGTTFSAKILHKGPTGFGLLEMALGIGVAVGVLLISVTQKRVDHDRAFAAAVTGAGAALIFSASMANIGLVMLGVGIVGLCTGTVYVLGFTILGTTSDDLRGRIFGVFYTLIRLCLLLAFTLAPFLSGFLGSLSNHLTRHAGTRVIRGEVGTSAFHVALPGARLTLWLGGLIILLASWFARRDLRKAASSG